MLGRPLPRKFPAAKLTPYTVIRGIKRCTGQQTRTRLPIILALMRNLRNFWRANRHDRDHAMLWAATCMCLFGFMRAGELVVPSDMGFDPLYHLAFGDVLIDSRTSPSYLVVKLKASKTDPFADLPRENGRRTLSGSGHPQLHGEEGSWWPILQLWGW